MKQISVVIPCYNQGGYLDEAVDSVLAQSRRPVEIVIVNDGSTDPDTNDLLAAYDRPGCRVLQTANRGLPAARNTGIRAAAGEYICCLDADDKYHPEYFARAAAVLDSDQEMRYGAVPAWVRFFGSSHILWKTMGHNCEGFVSSMQGLRNNIQSATMFRRKCWEEIGGFDESMTLGYEDWDFWIKMLHRGYQWFCLEEELIYYRRKEQSMVTRADAERPRLLEQLIRNNREFYERNLIALLLARDEEVRRLQRENAMLSQGLAGTNPDDNGPAAGICRRVGRTLKKIFPA
ncbi:MAG: glycosyltransferase family A protein [Desulfobulbaceae bacterium]